MKFIFGIFIFVLFLSCKKKDSVASDNISQSTTNGVNTSSNLSINTAEYIKFSLSNPLTGNVTTYTITPSPQCCWPESTSPSIAFSSGSGYRLYSIDRYSGTQPDGSSFEVWKRDTINSNSLPINLGEFKHLFKLGNTNYSKWANSLNVFDNCGVAIRLNDNNNVYWSSNPLASSYKSFQDSSMFNITDTLEYINTSSRFSIKFKANFKCKLYNYFGDSIYLSNGEIITNLSN